MNKIIHDSRFIYDVPINVNLKYRIKKIIAPLFSLFYKCILFINRPKQTVTKKYQLVACAIFKDEAIFIKEWIEHNHLVGVEHFYMYNNFSSDHYQEVLSLYIDQGIVTLIEWPVEKGQFPAYEHFWVNYQNQSQWITFIDLDEFYCPIYDLTVTQWLQKHKHQPSVVVYWKMFGTSGEIYHKDDKLVTEQYTVCWDKLDSIGKVIINTDWEFSKMYHHYISAKCKLFGRTILVPSVDDFGYYTKWNDIDHKVALKKESTMQLNHYWSKSYDSYRIGKIERGDVNNFTRNYDLLFLHEKNNRTVDYSIFRFLVKLKLKMSGNNDI